MKEQFRRIASWLAAAFISLIAIVIIVVGGSTLRFGSIRAAQAYLRGQVLVADQPERIVGTVPHGATLPAEFSVQNLTSGPVAVIGTTSSCACAGPENLPMEIPPGQSRKLRFNVGSAGQVGPFRQTFQLFLSVPPPVILTASGDGVGHPPHAVGEITELKPIQ